MKSLRIVSQPHTHQVILYCGFAIFLPTTCSSAAVVHVPSFAALFSAFTTFVFLHSGLLRSGQSPGLKNRWIFDRPPLNKPNSIMWHYKCMAGSWKSGQGSKGKPVLYCMQKQKAVLVWCKAWICHDSSYRWLKTMAKIIFPHFTHFSFESMTPSPNQSR